MSTRYSEIFPVPALFEVWGTDHLWEEPLLPIAEREAHEPVPSTGCVTACIYGECRAPGSYLGCGGCCACLRACAAVWEQQQSAPLLWTGDSA